MLDRILPERIDNHYRGHRFALWVFYPITLMTVGRSLIHIFRSDGGAQSIATIPLDTFVSGGAETVISVFALWGLSQLLIGLLFVLVSFRYRAMIPLHRPRSLAARGSRFSAARIRARLTRLRRMA